MTWTLLSRTPRIIKKIHDFLSSHWQDARSSGRTSVRGGRGVNQEEGALSAIFMGGGMGWGACPFSFPLLPNCVAFILLGTITAEGKNNPFLNVYREAG